MNGKPIEIEISYCVKERISGLRVYFDLIDDDQNILIRSFHDELGDTIPVMEPGTYMSIAIIPKDLLAPRLYEIKIRGTIFNVRSCTGDGVGIPLVVESTNKINRGYAGDTIRSKLQPYIEWETKIM